MGKRIRCAKSRVSVAGMDKIINQSTPSQVLEKLRRRYGNAGLSHMRKLINQAVQLLGYQRKAAIRSLGRSEAVRDPLMLMGRPVEY